MKQFNLTIQTPGRGYYLITDQIQQAVSDALVGVEVGLVWDLGLQGFKIKIKKLQSKLINNLQICKNAKKRDGNKVAPL